jgi:hypothetical protein
MSSKRPTVRKTIVPRSKKAARKVAHEIGPEVQTPEARLQSFLEKFTPEIAAQAAAALNKMRQRLPGAAELVYDNYNALAIGFGPNERTSDILFSIAVYPRWVSLFLMGGPELDDPHKLLKGSGTMVRHIVLASPEMLDKPEVGALIAQVLAKADPGIDPKGVRRLVIKSVSAKQRPRRPGK